MESTKTPADWIGKRVFYSDPHGKIHDALITYCFSVNAEGEPMTVNVVYVTDDTESTDQYGRQIIRKSSCPRKGEHSAWGNWFVLHES